MRNTTYLISCFFIALTVPAFSQTIFFNNGAMVYAAPGSIVHINGGAQNDGTTGTLDNNGTITIANSGTPGTYFLKNSSLTKGNGLYRVQQDWVNDAAFQADSSTVELYGDLQQFITSTTGVVTTFDTLVLTGSGTGNDRKKTLLNVDARVSSTTLSTIGALIINDRELATDNNTMYVHNTDVNCVTNNMTYGNEGFVSSLGTGSLSRDMINGGTYKFPTGSSLGILRYRQLDVTPNTAGAFTYTARLANNSGTVDSYDLALFDNNLCTLNDKFYHVINQTSGTANGADVKVYYDVSADGSWSTLAEWNIPTSAIWNDLNSTPATSSPYSDVTETAWFDANLLTPQNQLVLGNKVPSSPVLACADVCASSLSTLTATGTGPTFTWTVPTGATIVSGQGTNTIIVNWGSTTGTVSVTQSTSGTCQSFAATCSPAILTAPIAGFDTVSKISVGTSYIFTDTSNGATSWIWNFGDNTSSTLQNPVHDYTNEGVYVITQIATSANGCSDTTEVTIKVDNCFTAPNVFSPNNDGQNDDFRVTFCSGVDDFKIEIYDRWGLKLYESTDAAFRWDGRTSSGKMATDGTYYFVLLANSKTKKYDVSGYLTLVTGNR